jgi:hypothetical protein
MTISLSVLPRMRNVSDKLYRESKHTLQGFLKENRAVYEIMWNIMVRSGRPRMTIKYGVCAFYD